MGQFHWWLKVRIELADEPEVLALAQRLNLDPDAVVGKLVRIWGWAYKKGVKGVVIGADVCHVSSLARTANFGEILLELGWLSRDCHAGVTQLTFPDFEKYCPETERRKGLAAMRQREKRARDRHAPVTLASRQCHTKVTPKSKNKNIPPPPPEGGTAEPVEPASTETAKAPPVLSFPTVGPITEWHLTESQIAEWRTAYPALDVLAECRKALAWVQANPANRKTARGMPRFLVGWLGRAQDQGRGRQAGPAPKPSQRDLLDQFFPEGGNG